jgi:hypothetical protein
LCSWSIRLFLHFNLVSSKNFLLCAMAQANSSLSFIASDDIASYVELMRALEAVQDVGALAPIIRNRSMIYLGLLLTRFFKISMRMMASRSYKETKSVQLFPRSAGQATIRRRKGEILASTLTIKLDLHLL